MLIVPTLTTPAQTLVVTLAGQPCRITLRQLSTGLFFDIATDARVLRSGILCLNMHRLIRDAYLGFTGDLAFSDTQGTNDPDYTGLGPADTARYLLLYFAPGEQ